ncbi:MAG TPA: plastocyanin/azurin family copper-binding protein [bacterium]|nr:plastocyanin/azurin family copper-binding protein [bacterium]
MFTTLPRFPWLVLAGAALLLAPAAVADEVESWTSPTQPIDRPVTEGGAMPDDEVVTYDVEFDGEGFVPPTVEVEVGDTVVWTNRASTVLAFTSDGDVMVLDSGDLKTGATYRYTFTEPGTYRYRSGDLEGIIVVNPRGKALMADDDDVLDRTRNVSRDVPPWAVNRELPPEQRRTTDNPATGNPVIDNTYGYRDPKTFTVQMTSTIYEPATITIYVGDTIKWENVDSVPHRTTSQDNVAYAGYTPEQLDWDSPVLGKGETWKRTFNIPGTYVYFDGEDQSMHGQVIVLPKGDPHVGEAG